MNTNGLCYKHIIKNSFPNAFYLCRSHRPLTAHIDKNEKVDSYDVPAITFIGYK